MEEAKKAQVTVFYKVKIDETWTKHGRTWIEKESLDKVKEAFSNALARQGTPVGSGLKFGAGLFFVGTALTYAACAKWGQSKWLTTVPAFTGFVLGVGGRFVSSYETSTARAFLIGKEGGKCFEEEEKTYIRNLYGEFNLTDIELVAVGVRGSSYKFRMPVWVIEKGE